MPTNRQLAPNVTEKPLECRIFRRFACSMQATCRLVGSTESPWLAMVQDVSPGGVGIVMDRSIEPGTQLIIEITDAPGAVAAVFLAAVAHASERSDGTWLIGCSFVNEMSK